jgi:hypothetical protein
MTEHQERVVAEKAELETRLEKLEAFIDSNAIYNTLHPQEQHRLRSQRYFMSGYVEVLQQRIDAFTD